MDFIHEAGFEWDHTHGQTPSPRHQQVGLGQSESTPAGTGTAVSLSQHGTELASAVVEPEHMSERQEAPPSTKEGHSPSGVGRGKFTKHVLIARSYLTVDHCIYMAIENGDTVEIEYVGELQDGEVFDTSRKEVAEEAGIAQADREYEPLTVNVGEGQLIEGFENALYDLEPGVTETVTIPPEKAYGEWSEENVREYGRDDFEQMIGSKTPEEGAYLRTQNGGRAQIASVEEDVVHVDFNHELAGETLMFEIEVLSVE